VEELNKSPENSASGRTSGSRIAETLIREAYEFIHKEKYQEAADIFTDILKRFGVSIDDKEQSLINSELATLCFWLGDFEGAKRHAEQSLKFIDNDQAYIVLGKIAIAEFKFAPARGHFSKVSEDNPARYFGLCFISIRLRDAIGANSFLRQAEARTSTTDPEFRLLSVYLELLKGDAKNAVLEARDLRKKCQRDPALLLIIGEIFMTAGNYGEAKAVAEEVLDKCPENEGAFAILAHAHYAEETYSEAEKAADEAVRLNPFNAYAKTVLMKLAVRRGSYSVAENIGKQILSDSPEYSLAHANLGDVYFIEGSYELAEIEYDQTNQLMNADTKGARLRQARMLFIKKDYAGSAKILEKLIESYHTYFDDAMCDLVLCYDTLEDAEKKEDIVEKMQARRYFYHRTEKILKSFNS
jgi:tetratricopeptide (TPR) repeat protein